jgi:hypothetical protein
VRVNRVESYFEVGSTKGRKVPVSTRICLNNVRCLRNVRKGEGGGQGTGSDDLGLESGRRKGCSDGPVDAPRGRGAEGHPTVPGRHRKAIPSQSSPWHEASGCHHQNEA